MPCGAVREFSVAFFTSFRPVWLETGKAAGWMDGFLPPTPPGRFKIYLPTYIHTFFFYLSPLWRFLTFMLAVHTVLV